MRKRNIGAAVGAAVAGTALALTFQGSASAAPAAPVVQQAPQESGDTVTEPQALASLAAKATVHAKAAAQSASDVADNFSLGSLLAAPANISGDVSGSTAFDK